MKFIQLFGAIIAVLTVPHCLAVSTSSNNLRDNDVIHNEQRAPSQLESNDNDIAGQTLVSCKNGKDKLEEDVGSCDTGSSRGFLSAHNCKNRGGKYYYCVLAGKAGVCTAVRNAIGLEHGECFL